MTTTDDLDALKAKMTALTGKRRGKRTAEREPVVSLAKVKARRERKNSRTKGSTYELRIARLFAAWSGELVRRTPLSGGWSSAKFGVTGDLVCDNPAFPFHVECKKREGWTLDDLVTGARADDTRSVVAWWKQTITTCPPGKLPILVFTRNHQPDLMMVRYTDADALAVPIDRLENTLRYGDRLIMRLHTFLLRALVPDGLRNHGTEVEI